MAPKSKKEGGGGKSKDSQETEDPLQAVILTDSFESRFKPLTLDLPRCLMPVCNVPVIEYTLELLARSGIEELFIYCGAHADKIESYLLSSKWSHASSPFKLSVLQSESQTIGEAMRDLDTRGILVNDFFVVYGDVVSNVSLLSALTQHRARRIKDKNAIMTMVLRQEHDPYHSQSRIRTPLFVLAPEQQRCLHYEEIWAGQHPSRLELDPDLVTSHQEIELRHDLVDCGIDICTPDALALWSDNFDFQNPRRNYLHSVLKDFELNGKTIHTYIIDGDYAARVSNLRSYDRISRDMVMRRAYPLLADGMVGGDQSLTKHDSQWRRGFRADRHRLSNMKSRILLGDGTTIEDKSKVSDSVLGQRCSVGSKCTIENSYLWDDVTVEDGSQVRRAIVGNGVVIGKDCVVEPGVVIASGIQVPDRSFIKAGKRLAPPASPSSRNKAFDKSVNEDGSFAQDYTDSDSDEQEEQAGLAKNIYENTSLAQSRESISTLSSDMDEEEFIPHRRPQRDSFMSTGSQESEPGSKPDNFYKEATDSVYDGMQRDQDPSNIQLELISLRNAANASWLDVRKAVSHAIVKHVLEIRNRGLSFKDTLKRNQLLIDRVLFDKGEDKDDKEDQVSFLLLTQKELESKAHGGEVLSLMCNFLLLSDAIESEGLEQWWEDPRSSATEGLQAVKRDTQKIIDAIAGSDTESESD